MILCSTICKWLMFQICSVLYGIENNKAVTRGKCTFTLLHFCQPGRIQLCATVLNDSVGFDFVLKFSCNLQTYQLEGTFRQ
jgi:hypothetical protein